jgi:DNA polymerase III subunit beta
MKLQIQRSTLVQVLQKLQGIAERKSNMPVLANVLLQASAEGRLSLSATDLELSYRTHVETDIEQGGGTTVSAKKLLEIVKEISIDTISLQTLPNERLAIRAGRSYFELSTIPVEDFPYLVFYEDAQFFPFEKSDLKECLSKTHFVIPSEEDAFSISGLFLHATANKTHRFVGSDGHRLAYVEVASDRLAGLPIEDGIIIPRKGVQEMLRMVETYAAFELAIHENCLIMRTADSILTVRLLDDEFPEYQQIIPEERPFTIQMDRQALLHALRRIATLTNQKYRHVRLKAKPNVLLLESGNPEDGDASDEIDVAYEGEEFVAAFNIRYLVDAVECMHSQSVRFEWVDSEHGGIFLGGEDSGYLALIMPMIL